MSNQHFNLPVVRHIMEVEILADLDVDVGSGQVGVGDYDTIQNKKIMKQINTKIPQSHNAHHHSIFFGTS